MWGPHVLRSWSSAQNTIALSSGEAELYAMVKAAAQLRYVISLAGDFGVHAEGQVFSDSSAAIGIVRRAGLGGRTRHVQVQYLWLQEMVAAKFMALSKVKTEDNVADILTKPVSREVLDRHLEAMGFAFPGQEKR